MRVAVFIVRYRETEHLYKCIESVGKHDEVSVCVINNYGVLELPLEYAHVKVLNNVCRPDFSTGHLSRNWNQAIINGFRNLKDPACDAVIGLQADACLAPGWLEYIRGFMHTVYYVSCGRGDEFQLFTPTGIHRVGLYDERFCNIGFQEGDYFLRSVLRIPANCAILDAPHGRLHNPYGIDPNKILVPSQGGQPNDDHLTSMQYHAVSKAWFDKKYNNMILPSPWMSYNMEVMSQVGVKEKEFMYYPYFERDIDPSVYAVSYHA